MRNCESVIFSVLCMVYAGDQLLLQNRVKEDWKGLVFPGGHVEKDEPFVDAVKREMKEETGLIIVNPRLCGIRHFKEENGIMTFVLLFKTNEYTGTLRSSEEGEMRWINRNELSAHKVVDDFFELLRVFDDDTLNEFVYNFDKTDRTWSISIH